MLEKVLSKIPDKIINGAVLAGMLILFTGMIRNTYSRGRPKYAKFYADVDRSRPPGCVHL